MSSTAKIPAVDKQTEEDVWDETTAPHAARESARFFLKKGERERRGERRRRKDTFFFLTFLLFHHLSFAAR